MSDVGEMFGDLKDASREKRARNRDSSASLLAIAGVHVVSKNAGTHLICGDPPRFNFWPGTGLYEEIGTGKRGRGVRNLLNALRATTGGSK